MSVPITIGTGTASVAAEVIGTQQYQQIKVVGGETGSTSILGVNPDRSLNASIIGIPKIEIVSSVAAVVAAVANQSVSGAVTAPPGSIATVVFPAGSVTAVTFATAANQSVSGAITAPPGSIMTIATLAGSIVSISGTVTAPAGSVMNTVSPAGSITAVSGATTTVAGSVMSVTTPAGSITAISGATTTTAGSVISSANPAGSITAVRTDAASIITVVQSSSVIAVSTGSVISVPSGSVITVLQNASIVGTYAEDAAHSTADKGIFSLNVRNDTLASITSADGDYSPMATGPIGEAITANAPITKWIQGTADLRVVLGTSVAALAAQGASIFTYVTAVQIANMGPSSVLVTLAGGLGSVLGYTIAPAGGGSNILYPNALKTGANSAFTASISGTASVLVSAQGFIAKI